MDVKEAREIVEGMELSAEAILKIDEILTPYESSEDIPDEVIDKILAIVDIEMDATKLAADIYATGAEMASEFVKSIDNEAGKIADEIDDKLKKAE
ncbi:hypothetical protein HYV64_05380 [Candidatus Shapirobacteria bacterium]|nr:hypothetical protein [Candidatus Shapirobacteria bacterium]